MNDQIDVLMHLLAFSGALLLMIMIGALSSLWIDGVCARREERRRHRIRTRSRWPKNLPLTMDF